MKIIKKDEPKIELGGQLWEECEKCGKEPVYTRFHLCRSCSLNKLKWPHQIKTDPIEIDSKE